MKINYRLEFSNNDKNNIRYTLEKGIHLVVLIRILVKNGHIKFFWLNVS